MLKKCYLCYPLKVFSTLTFTFKHFMINKSRNCYSNCQLFVAVMLNQIQDLKSSIKFPFWNLNGLAAHIFSKVSLLQAISVSKKYDLICLSETFLDQSIDSLDERITIEGYNLLRADHPSNKKGEESAFIVRNIFLSLKELTCVIYMSS